MKGGDPAPESGLRGRGRGHLRQGAGEISTLCIHHIVPCQGAGEIPTLCLHHMVPFQGAGEIPTLCLHH